MLQRKVDGKIAREGLRTATTVLVPALTMLMPTLLPYIAYPTKAHVTFRF